MLSLCISALHPSIYMAVWLVAKFGMASAFMCCFVYGSEIFPVQYRNICLGFCATISNIGAMMSPHCNLLVSIFVLPEFSGIAHGQIGSRPRAFSSAQRLVGFKPTRGV